jgi:hypothetical protein
MKRLVAPLLVAGLVVTGCASAHGTVVQLEPRLSYWFPGEGSGVLGSGVELTFVISGALPMTASIDWWDYEGETLGPLYNASPDWSIRTESIGIATHVVTTGPVSWSVRLGLDM